MEGPKGSGKSTRESVKPMDGWVNFFSKKKIDFFIFIKKNEFLAHVKKITSDESLDNF